MLGISHYGQTRGLRSVYAVPDKQPVPVLRNLKVFQQWVGLRADCILAA
jgi:hypothetical protein